MFNQENRYITCGIDGNLPIELQQYLWMCVDLQTAYNEEIVDYLQVFTFEKVGTDILAITQSQEKPSQKTIHYTGYKPEYDKIIDEKIFVIDDGDHSTMLFAHEY